MSSKRQARVYENVNVRVSDHYYNYRQFSPRLGSQDDYEVIQKIGRGKFSNVYEAVRSEDSRPVVIKILKPVKPRKIKREIKILQNLAGGPNIITLLDVVKNPELKMPCLVFELVRNTHERELYPTFTDYDARYYMLEILKALDFAHSKGIMHRDLKPNNIMIDHERRKLKVIDWGMAEFYFPKTEFNTRVAPRSFKAPELLVHDANYDYSLDMWNYGAIFAGLIFHKMPFFHGRDHWDQLVKITKVLGSDELNAWLAKYDFKLPKELGDKLSHRKRRSWKRWIGPENKHLCTPDALDFLEHLLRFDPAERFTPREAMHHPYFHPVFAKTGGSPPEINSTIPRPKFR